MNAKILFALFWAFICSHGQLIFTNSNEICNTCINSNNGSYWWALNAHQAFGYCWLNGNPKDQCISTNYASYECSNDTLPQRAEYLLCPEERSQCQSTSDFVTVVNERNGRIETGNVSSGITCKYLITNYDPITLSPNNSDTHNVTISVEYVHSDTYLGVYRYDIRSDTVELINEVGTGFTGNITSVVDLNYEVYVQMYPNNSMSSARFSIRTIKVMDGTGNTTQNNTITSSSNSSSDDGISTGAVVAIVLVSVWIIVILGGIGVYIIYRKYYKNNRTRQINWGNLPTSQNEGQVDMNNQSHSYMNNQEVVQIAQLEVPREDEPVCQPQIQINQDQNEAVFPEAKGKKVYARNIEADNQEIAVKT